MIGTKSDVFTLAQNWIKRSRSPFCHKEFLERQAQEELGEEAQEDADASLSCCRIARCKDTAMIPNPLDNPEILPFPAAVVLELGVAVRTVDG